MPVEMMNQSTGEVEQVPEEQVQQAYASGQYGLAKDAELHVVGPDGTVGKVTGANAGTAFAGGARIASPDEVRQAQLESKYGGVGGTLAAGGEAAARGITLGLSDPLAVGAARLLGGDQAADAVRTHLAEEKEAHPILSTAAEIAGAAAPIFLSGGSAAAVEGADEAGTLARIAEGIRTIGAAPRGVTALGDVTEHAIGAMLGEGGGILGSAARAAARQAARGIVEGGLFGAGSAISDATLENKELTAEQLMSQIGHSALTAGLLAGTLGGVGDFVSSGAQLLGSSATASGKLSDAAGEQTWRWLDPAKGLSEEATKRAGGTDAVGRTVFDRVLKPLVEERGLAGAAIDNDTKLELVQKALDDTGKQIGDLVASNADATVSLRDMLKPIDDRIQQMSSQVGHEGQVGKLQELRDSVTRILGGTAEEAVAPEALAGATEGAAEAAAPVARTPEEIGQFLREHPEVLQQAGNGPLPEWVRYKTPEPMIEAPDIDQLGVVNAKYIRDQSTYRPESLQLERARYAGATPEQVQDLALKQRPIDVHTEPDGSVVLDDGRHRLMAADEAGAQKIMANVRTYDAEGNVVSKQTRPVNIHPAEVAEKSASPDVQVPIAKAIEQRRALQQIAYQEAKTLDPNQRVALLREISGSWNDLEESALDKASTAAGTETMAGRQLGGLNKEFQQLKIAEKALEKNTARYASNRNLSLSDYLTGAAHAPSLLLTGHPLAAAAAVGSSFVHRAMRAHGNAYAALLLDRLSTWGGVGEAVAEANETTDRALDHFMSRRAPAVRAPTSSLGDFEREADRVEQAAAVAGPLAKAHVDSQVAPIAAHAPSLAASLSSKIMAATAYLASKLPPRNTGQFSSITPQLEQDHTSPEQKVKFLRYVDAVDGGPPAIMKRLAAGKMTSEDVETMRTLYPESYKQVCTKVATLCANRKTQPSYAQRMTLGRLLDIQTDPTMAPQFIQIIQQSFQTHPQAPAAPGKPPRRSAPANLKLTSAMRSPTENAMEGEAA